MQLRAWLAAFIFTQLIEIPIYFRGLSCSLWAAFGASAITHPIVWFGFFSPYWRNFYSSGTAFYYSHLVMAELFAWLAEAAYFRFLFKKQRALLWAAIANAASLGLGFLSRYLFGVP